jgi:hypothetical protein
MERRGVHGYFKAASQTLEKRFVATWEEIRTRAFINQAFQRMEDTEKEMAAILSVW